MTRSLAFGVALVLALGCGAQSVTHDAGGDDDSSRGGTSGVGASPSGGAPSGGAGGSGAAMGGGGSAAATSGGSGGSEQCRIYASRWVQDDQDEASECAFDRASLTLSCKTQRFALETTTWPTLDAFLANSRPIGYFTFAERRFVNEGGCDYTQSFHYDEVGRLEALVATPRAPTPNQGCGDDSYTFTAWDTDGRPREGTIRIVNTRELPRDFCTEQPVTFDYDDANQRYTEHPLGGNGLVGCRSFTTTWTFDSDGLLVSERLDHADGTVTYRTYTTLATERVCRD